MAVQKSVSVGINAPPQPSTHSIRPYRIIKSNAGQLPLRDDSLSLVLATPPYIGARLLRSGDYCTSNPDVYRLMIHRFLAEALRVVEPHRHVLITSSRPPSSHRPGVRKVIFQVLRKERSHDRWILKKVKTETFWTHYVRAANTCWWALPVRIYQNLLAKYSACDEKVAHVFSGSGNGGLAALLMKRKFILVDLHYHRIVERRLNQEFLLLRRE